MLKHLFFVIIGVLSMCIPVTAHAEEAPTSDGFLIYSDVLVAVKVGDKEFTYADFNRGVKTITVTYGETTVRDILDKFSLNEPDAEKYRRVEPAVVGEDDEEGWYLWRECVSGKWQDKTTTKTSDVITPELIGHTSDIKGFGAIYEYLGKTTIKVVNEEGEEQYQFDFTNGFDALYTSEYPCWIIEQYINGEWTRSDCDENEFLKYAFDPYVSSFNLNDFRVKLLDHKLYEGTCFCPNCNKYVITEVSDLDKVWKDFKSYYMESNIISIESDIDYSGVTPTYALLPFFQYVGVTIDGHGHTISNFKGNYPLASDYHDSSYDNQTVKNLTIENFDITLTISDGRCDTKEGENDDVYVLIMGDYNRISNCNFTGKVDIKGEEDKNYIPCLGYKYLNLSNTTVSINGKKETYTGIADLESDSRVYVSGRKIIATEDVRIYNLMGTDVTALNGMLSKGVYIVKGSKTTKVVVR
ncbi:MAG: hypothetical protein MJZ27_04485 [Bacteroidales bacterium]|nr:hypothetical protein [Bacteroidales bacterium]